MALALLFRPLGPLLASLVLWLLPFVLNQLDLLTATELIAKSTICKKSIDIRNKLDAFNQLNGCQVVEGYLQILLFDSANETELAKISFPELTEITDYLLLFRVNGLRSIGQLFPNLAIIRGQNLFPSNKAFVIFEMATLQEIGLHSLTDILRGSVHIDKNPSLCYVHTIDWNRIVRDKSVVPYLRSFKPENECPVCPESVNGVQCPPDSSGKNKYHCWNREHCQKICTGCSTCNGKGQCCDPHCIGGCSDDDPKKCVVCRNYAYNLGENHPVACVQSCPPKYYKYLNRRCVSKEECFNMIAPIEMQTTPNKDIANPYKIFNGSCLLQCPSNYADDYSERTCKKCDHTCKKECPGTSIDSINLAKQLRGCTHITSSLEIQIRGGNNVVKDLEDNLSMIEEIDGYLKVVRSFSLVSLNFLKNLRRIGGKYLESQKYSLVVLDNQNLMDLWDWSDNRTLKINNGTLFFHFNPKLCYSKIEQLQQKAGLPNFTELEVAQNSNGDKIACDVTKLIVNVTQRNSKGVILEWHPYKLDDPRNLLNYIVYSIEAPNRTVNFYDGRDACGQDNWHVDDVSNNPEADSVQHPLTNLKPYTQYAFYVRTYTIATEKRGAQSDIQYFTTKAAKPSMPRVIFSSNSSDSLFAKWSPPEQPNGKIIYYLISGKKHSTDTRYDNNRNYCKNPVVDYKSESPPIVLSTPSPKNDTCIEPAKPDRLSINEPEEAARIQFENALHNEVYVRRADPNTRRKRETNKESLNKYGNNSQVNKIPSQFPNDTSYPHEAAKDDKVISNETENGSNIFKSFGFEVRGETEFYIKNLHHFTVYHVYLRACREKEIDDDEARCSESNDNPVPTLRKVGADNITNVTITNKSLETVTVSWNQPQDPNGMIVSILFYYKREGSKNVQPNKECISIEDFDKYKSNNISMSYTITKLFPGNYSLCLRATSLAGEGEYSECVNFIIEEPSSYAIWITIIFVFILFCVVIGGGCWFYKKNKERDNMRLIPAVNPEYVPCVYVPDEWEVPRKKIELIKELGQGSFGMVWEGIAFDIRGQSSVRCAVKTVNEHATNRERVEFLNEASVMKAFDTTHVVRLLGVVSQGQPTLVIMELMANGDLKTYLRSHRPDEESFDSAITRQPPNLKQILQMAVEIADGMAYLEAKKFVHRDLAARNCMVSEELKVKIGDFGMTRDIYETDYYRKGTKGLLPVRWMAPESLKDGVFTSSSDVWSYGVVLWEMATLASQPYQGLSNDQVLRYVIDGGVMERPENCPDRLYALMRYCWQHKPSARPTFMKLCQLLLEDANPQFTKVSFYHSPEGNEARTARLPTSPGHNENDADAETPLRRPPDRARGYTPSQSQESDEIDIDTHHRFPGISEEPTANGYVGSRLRNGTAEPTEC